MAGVFRSKVSTETKHNKADDETRAWNARSLRYAIRTTGCAQEEIKRNEINQQNGRKPERAKRNGVNEDFIVYFHPRHFHPSMGQITFVAQFRGQIRKLIRSDAENRILNIGVQSRDVDLPSEPVRRIRVRIERR